MTVIIASTPVSKKITNSQERLEAIFHVVDLIKVDLGQCGMRLQEASKLSAVMPFTSAASSFTCTYGLADELLLENAVKGHQSLKIAVNEFFKSGRDVLIYDLASQAWETNEIESQLDGTLVLKNPLQNNYPINSMVVALKKVEYRYYMFKHVITRKIDKGKCQPLLEGVSDFYVTYFPDANSVLYRIEVNKKEQIRGYIFLLNLV